MKTGDFSINKRSRGTGRAPRGFHNLTLFKSTRNSRGRAGARGEVGHPLPRAQVGGAHCRAGALVGGSFSPRSDQSHAGDREANTDVSEEGVIVLGSGWGQGGGHTGHYIPPVSGPV